MQVHQNKSIAKNINSLDLVVGYSGYALLDPKFNWDNLVSPFNKLAMIESGEAYFYAGGESITVTPGVAYLIPAGLPCSYRCPKTANMLFFHFNLFKPDHFDFFQGFQRIAQVPITAEMLHSLVEHYNGSRYLDGMIIKQHMLQIITQIQLRYDLAQEEVPAYSEYVRDTIDYIHENLSAKLLASDLAKRLFISRSALAALFRKEVGISIGRYIDEQLMIAAQLRLDQTNTSIGDISRELGFADQCYFSRRFKAMCGLTPQTYRKKLRTDN